MIINPVFVIAIAASTVAGDSFNTWLSDMCTNADEQSVSPMAIGTCYEFGEAQSYILQKDDTNVYSLYSGGSCSQYVGQVGPSDACTMVDDATGIINIGPQSKKTFRFAREPVPKKARGVLKRALDGDTYQCPNIPSGIPYFFTVTQFSSATEQNFADDDTAIRRDFNSSFGTAYQANNGQTMVSSLTPLDGENDVQLTYTATQGVIHDIDTADINSIVGDLLQFRGAEGSPIRFLVGLYTGMVGAEGAGLIGNFDYNGD